ncbi:tyrosine-type recombinase/integrase [Lysobacter sp. F60174L2]|uniref:tyrosine-type recombinase/integrase n=1 Tax=Lysobacter sp. F60174L2 TaxID=3459295 RepID=UPI00403D84BC
MATYQARGDRWRAIVRRKGFKAKSRTFPTKTAARIWAERIERELADQEARGHSENEDPTIGELVDWYSGYVRRMKGISLTQKGNLTRVKEGLGSIVARRLTPGDIIEHVRRRRQGEHVNGAGHRVPPCGGATMNVELGYLSEMLKVSKAVGQLRLAHDPVAEARPTLRLMKLVSRPAKRTRRPTQDELNRLKAHFAESRWRMKVPMEDIIDFAVGSAKREGEITRLLWADLDAETRTALLRDAKHPRSKEGNHRRFPLLAGMWDLVQRQPRDGERIFPYEPDSIGTAFRRGCVALGIHDLRFHDLRHEATSRLFEQGYSIEQVATVTLHESWQELKRYTQLRPESLHRDGFIARPD